MVIVVGATALMMHEQLEPASLRRRVVAPTEDAPTEAANDVGQVAASRTGPVVLVASTCAWPSVPKLAIALAGASCTVAALAPANHPLNLTQAVSRRFRYSANRPLRALADAIAGAAPDLIIACDERVVEHLHRLHARTADHAVRRLIERSLGNPEFYARTASRQFVIDLAAVHGISAPETQTLGGLADLRAWAETRPPPWVLKVDGSWGGLGVRVVSSLAEAERAFHQLSRPVRPLYALRRLILSRDPFWLTPWLHQPPRPDPVHSGPAGVGGSSRITVQRYIQGRPANCVITAWNGAALDGVAVDVIASEGETGPASVVRLAADPAMLIVGARIIQELGLSGLIGFDFLVEAETGRLFLLEMNPRPTPISHLRLGAGHDPIGALVAQVSGRPAPDYPAETVRDTIALFPQADLQLPGHPILAEAYHDTPLQDPRLVRALLRRRTVRRASPIFSGGVIEAT